MCIIIWSRVHGLLSETSQITKSVRYFNKIYNFTLVTFLNFVKFSVKLYFLVKYIML